jgi:hypothetical protein
VRGDGVHVALDHDTRSCSWIARRARFRAYRTRLLEKTGVSGELRYFGAFSEGSDRRPPKPTTRSCTSTIGKIGAPRTYPATSRRCCGGKDEAGLFRVGHVDAVLGQ